MMHYYEGLAIDLLMKKVLYEDIASFIFLKHT